jgi:hypothetical protein
VSEPIDDRPARVVVVDFNMPMGSMVRLMVKWAIASIPAIIIMLLIMGLVAGLLGGVLGALGLGWPGTR